MSAIVFTKEVVLGSLEQPCESDLASTVEMSLCTLTTAGRSSLASTVEVVLRTLLIGATVSALPATGGVNVVCEVRAVLDGPGGGNIVCEVRAVLALPTTGFADGVCSIVWELWLVLLLLLLLGLGENTRSATLSELGLGEAMQAAPRSC